MGIRFLCPNGHKLNVKAFLAGKRGICPQCDAKFLVPKESGSQAEVLTESPKAESPKTESPKKVAAIDPGNALPLGYASEPPPVPAPPTPAPLTPAPLTPTPPTVVDDAAEPAEVWYVRTATGEQFGPASTEVLQGWVAEGRVAVDCWVWRTGWPDWKSGGHALTFLNGPQPESRHPVPKTQQPVAPAAEMPVVPSHPTSTHPTSTHPTSTESLPASTSATATYQSSKHSRQERARKVTFFLGGVVLLLFVVLITVLIKNSP